MIAPARILLTPSLAGYGKTPPDGARRSEGSRGSLRSNAADASGTHERVLNPLEDAFVMTVLD